MEPQNILRYWLKCSASCAYFMWHFVEIEEVTEGAYIKFEMWPEQKRALDAIERERLVIILKARQLGLTWLVLAYALWLMLFRSAATVLLFSLRDDEAMELLSRLKDMYWHLPEWMRARATLKNNEHVFELSNGSSARAFPSTAGDSYTASLVIADEFDLVEDQSRFMRSVKPTIDAGGKMLLVSRADKSKPQSLFKRMYRAAKRRENDWTCIFLPWFARPIRDGAWYDAQKRDILARSGALDDLFEQYPATDTEALAPRALDKRFPAEWLDRVYNEVDHGLLMHMLEHAPAIAGLEVFDLPAKGRKYVIGADPAEGNPNSDDSAIEILDRESGDEVAALAGKFEPAVFAGLIDHLGRFYNRADVLVLRNNHGHAVLGWLKDHSKLKLLCAPDGRAGFPETSLSKAQMCDAAADSIRLEQVVIHSFAIYTQLSQIEGATLRAPEGEHDDRASAYTAAIVALSIQPAKLKSGRVNWAKKGTGVGGQGAEVRERSTDEIEAMLA